MIDDAIINQIKEMFENRDFITLSQICKISLNESKQAVIRYNSVKKSILKDKDDILEKLVITYASMVEALDEERKI